MQKPVGKTGVVYISHIPPGMKDDKLMHILGQYGEIRHHYIRQEADWKFKEAKERGTRRGRLNEDGWVEFLYKVHAKECAKDLNLKPITEKGSWNGEFITLKYLHGFKWEDLQEALKAKRKGHTETVTDETAKAKKRIGKFLKHTKAVAAGAKPMSKEHKEMLKEEGEDDE